MKTQNDLLTLLGLTEYEGRVYRALLVEHPATAYRLGKRSGVPLSRVYEVANRLVEKGAATLVPGEPAAGNARRTAPPQYAPVPPETLVNGARARATRQLDALAAELSALFGGRDAGGHGWIRGAQNILSRAASLAAEAQSEILLAAAPDALDRLQEAIANPPMRPAMDRRIRTHILTPSARGEAAFVLLIDGAAALIGRLGAEADALSTRHPVLARLCADYFRLRDLSGGRRRAAGVVKVRSDTRHPTSDPRHLTDWLDWEEEKQRRLLQVH